MLKVKDQGGWHKVAMRLIFFCLLWAVMDEKTLKSFIVLKGSGLGYKKVEFGQQGSQRKILFCTIFFKSKHS